MITLLALFSIGRLYYLDKTNLDKIQHMYQSLLHGFHIILYRFTSAITPKKKCKTTGKRKFVSQYKRGRVTATSFS